MTNETNQNNYVAKVRTFIDRNFSRLANQFLGRTVAVQRRDERGAIVVDADYSASALHKRIAEKYGNLRNQEVVLGTIEEIMSGVGMILI